MVGNHNAQALDYTTWSTLIQDQSDRKERHVSVKEKKEQNYTVNEGSEKNIKTQNNHATGSSLAKNPRSLGDHRNTKKNRPAMIVKLLRTYTNLKTLAELLIINTYINSKPWASTRHVQYGVVKTGTTFRYMQPIHRWSLPWQSVVLFFFLVRKKTGLSEQFGIHFGQLTNATWAFHPRWGFSTAFGSRKNRSP